MKFNDQLLLSGRCDILYDRWRRRTDIPEPDRLEGNIIGTQRYDGEKTSYYLYNKDIQGSTTSLIKEDGRFLTEDTYRGETKEADTWHLYAYCKNNPVNYKDPSGHVAIPAGYYMAMYIPGFGQVLLGATVVVGECAVYKGGS